MEADEEKIEKSDPVFGLKKAQADSRYLFLTTESRKF